MNILILAAGYATRLYPLTEKKAKPLLDVAGKPMIEWVIDNLAPIPDIDRVFVVTNNKFAQDFTAWSENYRQRQPKLDFKIINDGSTSDADKLGAIGDMHFAINSENLFEQDLIVVAGDNLFSQPVDGFATHGKNHPATIALYDVGDPEEVKKYNNITVDAEGRITDFEEKPAHPTSTFSGIALYYYRRDILPLINTYVEEGNNPDQPGRLVQWLYPRIDFRTWAVPGTWFDIGSKETLVEANRVFAPFAS
jgi:glucose-1-phosphate thymidylyltransferase